VTNVAEEFARDFRLLGDSARKAGQRSGTPGGSQLLTPTTQTQKPLDQLEIKCSGTKTPISHIDPVTQFSTAPW